MKPARILLVEDEAVIALELAMRLKSYGYVIVDTVVTGEQALLAAAALAPDLVLMDIMIQGPIDGIETARQLQLIRRMPVLFLSANSDTATVERARGVGGFGYLVKPFRGEELRSSIEMALERAQMHERLIQSEQWFAKSLQCIGDAVIATDVNALVRFMNPSAMRMTGWSLEQASGHPVDEVVTTVDANSGLARSSPVANALTAQPNLRLSATARLVNRHGHQLPVDESSAAILGETEELLGAVLVFRDVSVRQALTRALGDSEARFRALFEQTPMAMALLDYSAQVLLGNAALSRLMQCPPDVCLGQVLWQQCVATDQPLLNKHWTALREGAAQHACLELRWLQSGGAPIWLQLDIAGLELPSGDCWMVHLQDIDARKQAELALVRMAHFDSLTGLINRAWLLELGALACAEAQQKSSGFALILVNLDSFKTVNDSLGHAVGDQLLCTEAERLKDLVGSRGLVCRWGGDEYMLLLHADAGVVELSQLAERIVLSLGEPLLVGIDEARSSASLGLARYPLDGANIAELIVSADSAMHRAKQDGKRQYRFALGQDSESGLQQLRIEAQLWHALERQQLQVYYQPVLRHGRIESLEALLRWFHPELGSIGPDVFIPMAEQQGLILPIGDWVLREACRQLKQWHLGGRPDLCVAVNVSVRQLRGGGFVQTVAAALAESGLPPAKLELELTESWLMADPAGCAEVMHALRALGVSISVDDFGTGYSSLAYLKRLPVQRLKIDHTFMRDVPADPQTTCIVRAIISLARELQLDVVCEGIETPEQQNFVLGLGDLALQGFGLHRPAPAAELWPLLMGQAAFRTED
ncbi:two-component system response regulator [Roseateles oligotrophus]|uniref:EAL domain-containing protein n=1 Tax=Roseateles oligotrophus TaxID=1769250 RepID=A0ABT2YIX4_9BURK|nr:EAL domain-containing protein [Roseateles oligotrophus]MCV2369990.1 EAL domain-containing protein [Roseateles oligotrophus]